MNNKLIVKFGLVGLLVLAAAVVGGAAGIKEIPSQARAQEEDPADGLYFLRLADKKALALPELIRELTPARLVFIGESHDQEAHHRAQLAVIKGLVEAGRKVAVGLEMFRQESQAELDRWVSGELPLQEFLKVYYDNWTLPWPLYRDILVYARDQGLPLIGLNIPRAITRKVARSGFDSLDREELAQLPPIRCDVDPEYEDFIRRALAGHGHGGLSFTYFCEAQVVWDTAMARRLAAFLKDHPQTVVTVLAGSGHAWKQGIPRRVREAGRFPFKVILPGSSGGQAREGLGIQDTDYVWQSSGNS